MQEIFRRGVFHFADSALQRVDRTFRCVYLFRRLTDLPLDGILPLVNESENFVEDFPAYAFNLILQCRDVSRRPPAAVIGFFDAAGCESDRPLVFGKPLFPAVALAFHRAFVVSKPGLLKFCSIGLFLLILDTGDNFRQIALS